LPVFLVMVLFPAAVLGIFGESFEAGAAALVALGLGQDDRLILEAIWRRTRTSRMFVRKGPQ
jgi:hypothetical protein